MNEKQQPNNSSKTHRFWHWVKVTFLTMTTLAFIFIGSLSVYILRLDVWSSFDDDKIENVQQTLLIYDGNDNLTSSLYSTQNRINISIAEVPDYVKDAFLAAEDTRFYKHSGIDVIRVFGALLSDIKSRSLGQGASTISMQLIKNTHLSNEKAWSRKIEEAILTLKLESTYSKDEILEFYLNTVYFGKGAYGIEAAAQTYFGVPAKDLTLAQGALLAGVIKSPSYYAPHLHLESSITRRNLILDLMTKNEFISEDEALAAKQEDVALIEKDNTALIDYGFFTDTAILEAEDILDIDQETLLTSGYRIYTTMDKSMQEYCDELYANSDNFPSSKSDVQPQSAMVVLDSNTSEIKAIIGARKYTTRFGLNRATQTKRQPGSAIKPILVYAPALGSGIYTAASVFKDEKTDFNGYSPKNSGNTYHGNVTLRDSLTHSYNIPTVILMQKLGINYCKSFAETLGITFSDKDNNLALALGGFTEGVTPLQLANAYAAIANEGVYTGSTTIRRIEDSEGNVVYESKPENTRVLDEANAFILTNILESVVDDGTGKKLALEGIELAGKTGTVSIGDGKGNRDAWMVAYNSDYTAVVWMGYDNTNNAHHLASSVTGGSYPALLLKSFFSKVYTDSAAPAFQEPEGVTLVNLDKSELLHTGIAKIATAATSSSNIISEYFTDSTLPQYTSTNYSPDPPSDLILTKNKDNQAVVIFTPADKLITYIIYKQYPLSDQKIEVATVSGTNKKVMITDTGTAKDKTAYYFVVPKVITKDGTHYDGTTSKYLFYDPDAAIDETPTATTEATATPESTVTASPSPSSTPTVSPSATIKNTTSPTPSKAPSATSTNRPAFR